MMKNLCNRYNTKYIIQYHERRKEAPGQGGQDENVVAPLQSREAVPERRLLVDLHRRVLQTQPSMLSLLRYSPGFLGW